jgi:hypothetical protein
MLVSDKQPSLTMPTEKRSMTSSSGRQARHRRRRSLLPSKRRRLCRLFLLLKVNVAVDAFDARRRSPRRQRSGDETEKPLFFFVTDVPDK